MHELSLAAIATVSGSSYAPSGHADCPDCGDIIPHNASYYTAVHNVPAIIVNDNPDFDGGMVIGAGMHMILGWQTPDLRLFENTIEFMIP